MTFNAFFSRLLLCLFLLTSAAALHAKVQEIRIWQSPEQLRLVFDLSKPIEHRIFTLSKPHRVVIDLKNTNVNYNLNKLSTKDTLISRIRSGKRGKRDFRIVLDVTEALSPNSFDLPPNKKYPNHRLVIDLERKQAGKQQAAIIQAAQYQRAKRNIIIAIDAGHGGEDPGAAGPGRIREKDVVLSIAKRLQKLIKGAPGFSPFMVRTGDYYIGLRARTKKARKAKADFFVSIHADAFRNPKANGSSVYVLSQRGATSENARWLADRENAADLIGGVSLEDKEDHLARTLLDLSMTAKRASSIQLGKHILGKLRHVSRLHKTRVEEASFVVLKAPDMPALLVETGFISNPKEARKLRSAAHQKKLAQSIFSGIKQYFTQHPPQGTLLAWQQKQGKQRTYKVKSSDTLFTIALKYDVTVSQLKRLNRLQSNRLKVGQKLKIPSS